jgi:hypothetical protein
MIEDTTPLLAVTQTVLVQRFFLLTFYKSKL